jgi:hypothetical protein
LIAHKQYTQGHAGHQTRQKQVGDVEKLVASSWWYKEIRECSKEFLEYGLIDICLRRNSRLTVLKRSDTSQVGKRDAGTNPTPLLVRAGQS